MASVTVPAHWIAQQHLPPTCARHGGPATRWIKRRFFTKTPIWIFLVALVGLLIAMLLAMSIRKTVEGRLPGCDRCVRERRRFLLSVVVAWVIDLVLMPAAAAAGSAGFLVWIALTAAVLVWTFSGSRWRVHGFATKDAMWVELAGADTTFTQSINSALGHPAPPPPLTYGTTILPGTV